MTAALANTLWLASSWPEQRRFHRAIHHVAETQSQILRACLHANRHTEYEIGRASCRERVYVLV